MFTLSQLKYLKRIKIKLTFKIYKNTTNTLP